MPVAKICLVSFWFLHCLLRSVKPEKQEGLVVFPLLLALVYRVFSNLSLPEMANSGRMRGNFGEFGENFSFSAYFNLSKHNPQSSPTAMPAPFQGAYRGWL